MSHEGGANKTNGRICQQSTDLRDRQLPGFTLSLRRTPGGVLRMDPTAHVEAVGANALISSFVDAHLVVATGGRTFSIAQRPKDRTLEPSSVDKSDIATPSVRSLQTLGHPVLNHTSLSKQNVRINQSTDWVVEGMGGGEGADLGNMRDDSAQILFHSFLREAIVNSAGIDYKRRG